MKNGLKFIRHFKVGALCLIFAALTAFSTGANAQNITVTGVVTDAKGETVPGVSVVQQGSTNGTATDMSGKYTITVPSKSTLVFSSIGFKTNGSGRRPKKCQHIYEGRC